MGDSDPLLHSIILIIIIIIIIIIMIITIISNILTEGSNSPEWFSGRC